MVAQIMYLIRLRVQVTRVGIGRRRDIGEHARAESVVIMGSQGEYGAAKGGSERPPNLFS